MGLDSQAVMQIVDELDTKHEDAHKRLRIDLRSLEERFDDATKLLHDNLATTRAKLADVAEHAAKPVDATKLVLSLPVIVTIVIAAVSLGGVVWAANASLRSDVRDILTRMDAQKMAIESALRLQEVQSNSLKTAVDEMRRRQELQQYEISGLKETILRQRGEAK